MGMRLKDWGDREKMEAGWNARTMARYQRQMVLPQVGIEGQRRLLKSRVLIIGAGALGSAAATYLVAAGVGNVGLVDGDTVELSNLHRQILHDDADVGRLKTRSAAERLRAMNPEVNLIEHAEFLTRHNVMAIFGSYDLVVNGSDNFPTRYLINDAAVLSHIPLVDAAILRFEGQLSVFRPGFGCYRCLFPAPPPPGVVPDCAEAGIFGAVAGVLGSMEAVEALKILLDLADPDSHMFMIYDALGATWHRMPMHRDPDCAVCGDHPVIREPIDYERFCQSSGPSSVGSVRGPVVSEFALEVSEVKALMDNPAVTVVDVREGNEFHSGHLPRARHYPLEDLDRLLVDGITDTVLVVCAVGVRSAYGAKYLRSHGVTAFTLTGGMAAWRDAYPDDNT